MVTLTSCGCFSWAFRTDSISPAGKRALCCTVCKVSFRRQANPFCFSNQIFNTDCPHCHLQLIRSDLLRPDITALYWPICIGYCGNDIGVSVCWWAALQHGSTTTGKIKIHHLGIQTLAVQSRHTRQTQRRNRLLNVTMFWAAVMVGFAVQWKVCAICKAVTGGSMSSLGHWMMRGGVQIL